MLDLLIVYLMEFLVELAVLVNNTDWRYLMLYYGTRLNLAYLEEVAFDLLEILVALLQAEVFVGLEVAEVPGILTVLFAWMFWHLLLP